MYSVSNDYLDKITSSSRELSWYGSIKLASGTIVAFDTSNIASGGLSVNYDVSSDENPSIGNAFAGELKLNLYTDIDRYSLYGAEVTAYFRLYLTENTYEDVPLGVFYITEAERTTNMVSIVAYDSMTKLDSVKVAEDKSGSYPYEWIKAVVERGGLELGNTSAEIGAMPNGNEQITFTQSSETITSMSCRDALGYLSAVVCANAFIGRDGKVYIKGYDDAEVATIGADGRFSSSIADYTTRYTAVSLTISSTNATEYYAESTDDGLTFALGTNPFLQNGSSAERETVCRNILNGLSVIEYVPFSMGLPVRPELDIMDVLMLTGNQATSSIGAITSLDYSSGGSMNAECTGSNPLFMGVKTKTEKAIQQINNTVAKEINQMSVVQNSSAVTCGESTETSILTYNFEVTQEENTTMVDVSVVMTSSASETEANDVYTLSDIVAHLSFYVDGSEVSVYSPEFIVDEGKDTMTFNYSLSGLSVGAHQFDVRLMVDGGSGSIAAGDVHEMLWGYGITFEVYMKELDVSSLPDQQFFFVGQSLDYDGLTVDGVYNNGLHDDVTSLCEYYPTEGTVLSEYDVGTIAVNVTYNDLYTEFEIDVKQAYLYIQYPTQVDFGSYNPVGITTYNGRLIYVYSTFVGSNTELTWYKITPYENGSLDLTLLDTYDAPQYTTDPSIPIDVTYEYVHIGTKRIQTAGVGIMRNSVVRPFYYYDFADGSNGTLNVSFVLVGSSATLVRFGTYSTTDIEYEPKEVDGCILWPEITYTDSDGNSGSGYAVGNLSGTNLTIYVHRGNSFGITGWAHYTTSGTSTSVQGARSRPQLEHFTEKKYKYDISVGSTTTMYSLYELTCDGTSVTRTLIWSGEGDSITTGTASRHYVFCEFIPSARKFILATYWTTDFDAMVVDLDTLEAEHHHASSIYSDTLAQLVKNGYQPIYDPNIGKFVAVHGSTMYISDDLIYWSKVENIDSNTSGGLAVAYLPTDYGILTAAYTSGVSSYRYFSQLIYNKVE